MQFVVVTGKVYSFCDVGGPYSPCMSPSRARAASTNLTPAARGGGRGLPVVAILALGLPMARWAVAVVGLGRRTRVA